MKKNLAMHTTLNKITGLMKAFLRITLLLVTTLLSLNAAAVVKDYAVEVSITSNDNDTLGVMFRYQDSNNYYRFSIDSQQSWRRLDKTVNGVTTVLAEDAVAYTVGQTYGVTIIVLDDQISVAIDNQEILTATDTTFADGGVALYSKGNDKSYFDNLLITNLNDTQSVIDYAFDSSAVMEDLTIIDQGNTSGPSTWGVSGGRLSQTSNIYQSSDGLRARGTYAIINASVNSVASPSIAMTALADINASNASASQQSASVSANVSNHSVIAWEQATIGTQLGQANLFYNLYDSTGTPLVTNVKINADNVSANSSHHMPQIVLHDNNHVTAVWQDDLDGNGYYNIRLRQFDANGLEITPALTVHSNVSGQQRNPSVTTNNLGQVAVAWEDNIAGMYYRVFDASGKPLTGDIQINDAEGTHYHPRLLLADNGSVIAVWQEDADNNGYFNIRVRSFDASGQQLLAGFTANPAVAGHQYRPAISALPNNGFVIAYEDDADQNGVFDIRMRGFNSDGSERFADQSLNMISPAGQQDIQLAPTGNGGFVAVWAQTSNSVSTVVTRFFDSAGEPLTNDAPWSFSGTAQTQPAIGLTGSETLLLGWTEANASGTSTAVRGAALRYQADRDFDGIGDSDDAFPDDPDESQDTDGDGIGNVADTDDDNDGLPDTWEIAYGLNPLVADANQDADADGVNNGEEYADGTDPQNAVECNRTSCLPVIVAFTADNTEIEAGNSVTLQWQTLRADNVTIAPLGAVSTTGNAMDSPQMTTTYALTATSAQGQTSSTVIVTVWGVLSESTYNALGQRVLHENSEKTTVFVYGPQGEILAELDANGNVVTEYAYLEDQPLAQITQPNTVSTQTRYVHNDHLGTPQLLTDQSGQAVWQVDSQKPFGEVEINDDPDNDGQAVEFDLRFAGQYSDSESGLSYNYYRTYDPSLGRYIQSDPIGLEGGLNTYSYVFQNPVMNADPTGLICGTGACVGIAIAVGRGVYSGYRAYRAYRVAQAMAQSAAMQQDQER